MKVLNFGPTSRLKSFIEFKVKEIYNSVSIEDPDLILCEEILDLFKTSNPIILHEFSIIYLEPVEAAIQINFISIYDVVYIPITFHVKTTNKFKLKKMNIMVELDS